MGCFLISGKSSIIFKPSVFKKSPYFRFNSMGLLRAAIFLAAAYSDSLPAPASLTRFTMSSRKSSSALKKPCL
jgi:hypothetical protein